MESIVTPDSYIRLIGTITLLVSILCLFVTFFEKHRSHSTKLFAIMLVGSLSFFSSHWITYFAAIFIVATAVTELEFLQNLAAIIRKDENYFNYKKETLSQVENFQRKVEETIKEEYTVDQTLKTAKSTATKIDLSNLQNSSNTYKIKLSFEVEDRAFDYLTKEYGHIERGVRFKKGNKEVEVDGVIANTRDKEDIVFEVTWIRNLDLISNFMTHAIRRSTEQVNAYKLITGKNPIFYLVLVTNTKISISNNLLEKLTERAMGAGINLICLSLSEIGFEVQNSSAVLDY